MRFDSRLLSLPFNRTSDWLKGNRSRLSSKSDTFMLTLKYYYALAQFVLLLQIILFMLICPIYLIKGMPKYWCMGRIIFDVSEKRTWKQGYVCKGIEQHTVGIIWSVLFLLLNICSLIPHGTCNNYIKCFSFMCLFGRTINLIWTELNWPFFS